MSVSTAYWRLMVELAWDMNSDGCTVVNEWHQMCCLEHDVHYRTGRRHMVKIVSWDGPDPVYALVEAERISRRWADRRFRDCMEVQGGRLNDMRAWARWAGVRVIGYRTWKRYREEENTPSGT